MNLSKLDSMFTEASFGENASEVGAASSLDDLDFGIGKLCVSPGPYESTCARADTSSMMMLRSDVSAADVLSPFDSISFNGNGVANRTIKCDDVSAVNEANLQGQRLNEEQGCSTHDSSDLVRMHGPSRHEDAEAEVVDEIEQTQKLNDHLIVYKSSRRNCSRNTSAKPNHNNESKKPPKSCRVIIQKDSMPNVKSSQISRKKRSLLSKRAKSSVWGLPTIEENNVPDPCLGNEKIPGRVGGGQGKSHAIKDQASQKAVCKSSTPTGRISLKIKIGNQSFGVKTISGLCNETESKFRKEFPGKVLSTENILENVRTSDASAFDAHLDVTCHVENKSLGILSDQQISSHEEGDNLRPSTENRCSDPGTSPDSEVINSVPDASLGERNLQDLQDSPMALETSHGEFLANSIAPKMKSRKGKKISGGEKKHKVRGMNPRMTSSENPCTTSEEVCCGSGVNPSPKLSDAAESLKPQDYQSLNLRSNGQKSLEYSGANGGCKSRNGILNLPHKKGKASKKKGDRKNFLVKHQTDVKDDASGVLSRVEGHPEAGNQSLLDLGEIGDLSICSTGSVSVSSSGRQTGQSTLPKNAWVLCDECQKWRRIPATLADQIEQTNCRWTCKDNTDKEFTDCSIPQEKSNSEINEELEISDEDGDTMPKYNKNKSTAANQACFTLIKSNLFLHRSRKSQSIDEVMVCHCKPPSDGRIGCGAKCLNRMLNIECVQGTCPCGELCSNQQFQKRMYANLKWLRCGKKGFGLQTLQDISEGQFLIEYVGEVLDVHSHEARQKEYALQGHKHFYFMTLNGSEVIDACAKGNLGRFINHSCDPNCRTEKWMVNGEVCVGLFAIRDIKKGEEVTFDYNYVRVLGAAAKKCVCGSPNCRGYIGGDPTNSEVIVQEDSDDEFAEPVMICEDRAMNSVWADIMSQSVIEKENGSIDELEEERERPKNVNAVDQFQSIISGTSNRKVGVSSASHGRSKTSITTRVVDITARDKYEPDSSVGTKFASDAAVTPMDTTQESLKSSGSATLKAESESLLSETSSPVNLMEASFRLEEPMKCTTSNAVNFDNGLKMSNTLPGKLQPDAVESKKKLKFNTMRRKEEFGKSGPLAKTCDSSTSVRKGKLKSNVVNDKGTLDGDKLNAARHKSKKSPGLSLNSHVEAVEGKLNELLDTEGGISKRKDASRGYLKLLFLTAAFGTNGHGEAIQSNRDLSMILDALLKTKSRTVLVDIINKNGLQMLHNIMKRYRKEFNKTPILRKLLKVLEYLATREILTLELINGGPPRPGVESFKDSMLTLTEHSDKQVHQIARNFRDRWIPRSHRRNCFMEMDDGKNEFRQNSTYGKLSGDQWSVRGGKHADSSDRDFKHADSSDRGGKHADSSDRGGKRADSVECCDEESVIVTGFETSTVDRSSASGGSHGADGTRRRKRKSRWDIPAEECMDPRIRTSFSGDGKQNVDDDVPPGFSSPCNGPIIPASNQERETSVKHPSNIVSADSQERFIARMPLSYGIPSSLVQQFGVLETEAAELWTVAPGLPFHPFPPLPPTAIKKGEQLTVVAKCVSEPLEKTGEDDDVRYSGKKRTSPCSLDQPDINISMANEHQDFPGQEGSYSLGRKYFRQQKLNHSKLVRNGWEDRGSTRNGVPGVGLEHGTNQFRDS